jgi:hypothetical protein
MIFVEVTLSDRISIKCLRVETHSPFS